MTRVLPQDSWIGSVDVANGFIVTASFDGSLRVWDQQGKQLSQIAFNKEKATRGDYLNLPLYAVKFVKDGGDIPMILAASQDQSIASFKDDELVNVYAGHAAPVQCLDVRGDSFISGDWEGTVAVWSLHDGDDSDSDTNTNKRRRRNAPIKAPMTYFDAHKGKVTGVAYAAHSSSTTIYTSGVDATLREWNVELQMQLSKKSVDTCINAIDVSTTSDLLASVHTDGIVRIWDARLSTSDAPIKVALEAHKSWVSGVSWSNTSNHLLATCDYDGVLKVIDIRSTVPLFAVQAGEKANKHLGEHKDESRKLFCCKWNDDVICTAGQGDNALLYEAKSFH
jgi:WD40 repeat protein